MKINIVCIKVGSNVLTEVDGRLDISRIAHLVRQIKTLYDMGIEIYLISSGAVAAGRRLFSTENRSDIVSDRQVCAAVGQVQLINLYQRLFDEYGIVCGQVLVTKHDFEDRAHYLNMKNSFKALQANKVIPIINENDTVAVDELMFTDNDELAGLISTMVNADALIILSNVDGLYDGDPALPNSQLIHEISTDQDDFSHVVTKTKSTFGRGGMHTKYRIATKTADSGTNVFIANGKRDHILTDLVEKRKVPRTLFCAQTSPKSEVKKWIASSESYAKATVVIDKGASSALLSTSANSLLMVGVEEINGVFKRGDIIIVLNSDKQQIAIGRAGMGSVTATEHIGKRYDRPLVHYDYLCLM